MREASNQALRKICAAATRLGARDDPALRARLSGMLVSCDTDAGFLYAFAAASELTDLGLDRERAFSDPEALIGHPARVATQPQSALRRASRLAAHTFRRLDLTTVLSAACAQRTQR
jgi:hypothetical protein